MPSDVPGPRGAHRLSELLSAVVVLPDGREVGQVDDVRLAAAPDAAREPGLQDYVVDGFVVNARGEGALLGYDRREVRGPWLLRALVRAANRDASYVPWSAVRRIDWAERRVVVDRLEPLEDERGPA